MAKIRDGAKKIHGRVIGEGVKTGKMKEMRRVTEEIEIFTYLKQVSCNIIKLCSWEFKRLMKNDTKTKKQQRHGFMMTE